MAAVTGDAVTLAPSVQRLVRRLICADAATEWLAHAVAMLGAAFPDPPEQPARQAWCARLMPHVECCIAAVRASTLRSPAGWRLLESASQYLHLVGCNEHALQVRCQSPQPP